MGSLVTARLELVSISSDLVEAVLTNNRDRAEACVGAILPAMWPGRALVERAFYASLEHILANPDERLWGDRVMITKSGPRRVVGSVVFHGAPDHEGAVEVAYGVEEDSQRKGYATEGTRACVEWALTEGRARVVRAATPPWHIASQKVLERCGLRKCGMRDSPIGDIWEYERRGLSAPDTIAHALHP